MNEQMNTRSILAVTGSQRAGFLQGLVSNAVPDQFDQLIYAALLSPQGKYLFDFFMLNQGDSILIDVAAQMQSGLLQRLNMYRLRADVAIAPSDLHVKRGLGDPPVGALMDPRHPALGWRLYGTDAGAGGADWDMIRVAHCIPETGVELIPNETFILEAGFERLHGVDFKKGCYVGQEITARMKHKTKLQKGLVTVSLTGAAPAGTEIIANGKPAGTLYTQSGGAGIAYLRFGRATGAMQAGDAIIKFDKTS